MATVSIRAPVRGATAPRDLLLLSTTFRSAPPCGERLSLSPAVTEYLEFRSAPPCGERPQTVYNHLQTRLVSIRAPVRGATYILFLIDEVGGFDPRPRAGSDDGTYGVCACASVFRSAPPCGERLTTVPVIRLSQGFRSAPPCGERQ